METKRKGFTLIELMIVIAIIGILASIVLVSMSNTRTNATIGAYKSSLGSLQPAIGLCCTTSTNTLQTVAGGQVCSPSTNALLPTSTDIKADSVVYSVTVQCDGVIPTLNVTPTGLPRAACNSTATTVSPLAVTFPVGC